MLGSIPKRYWKASKRAWRDGRLSWRCTDAQGRSCNGGSAEPLRVGVWSEERDPVLCRSGWHLTDAPHRWAGQRVWLCEGRGFGGRDGDKSVWREIRVLAEVDPTTACSASLLVRCKANLLGANLSMANLSGANLSRADLYGANLLGANLSMANLLGACTCHTDRKCEVHT